MQKFDPVDQDYVARVRYGFSLQNLMSTIDARMTEVLPGEVHIELPFNTKLTQQHGYIHAGLITSIVDSACGFAAYTLMPGSSGVLTVEYKVNFLSPAKGDKFLAVGRVIKPGRTLTICNGEVSAIDGDAHRLVALMQATMMAVST